MLMRVFVKSVDLWKNVFRLGTAKLISLGALVEWKKGTLT